MEVDTEKIKKALTDALGAKNVIIADLHLYTNAKGAQSMSLEIEVAL